ncbi:hypothetical protein BX616_003777 [Lobosporangium transversale]|uniref:Uncharacterized protein n=1 Tax=Lobosporangium transversale TaxID=64571 RepID=A0A1Y2GXM6_9FUNG|nr:hypothetical protein BCR41DRAFT_384806 [Lobosporangium transversale]KAF9916426.1 hypothetical protein BX616_003777 [Lobosporangium transversale]ORZ25017.1 hypothetical protein BCR41DRAFT_384806 [Lobosporangium transversale]|eukprot:XP_021883998.1 hypothetical protein BCR41DRAFT_384806 [Lobosporangium transversale]
MYPQLLSRRPWSRQTIQHQSSSSTSQQQSYTLLKLKRYAQSYYCFHHYNHCLNSKYSSISKPPPSVSILTLLFLFVSSILSTVHASITCALPAGSSYKAGDYIILDWGSDGTKPAVSDITAINGTLYCNGNNLKIAEVSIPNLIGPYNWTVPSVGNATTVGGEMGTCPQNAFHMEYSGEAYGVLSIVKLPWGPVRCGTITILPAPNGTLTTTTTMSSTATTSSAASTSTESPNTSAGGGGSGLSMTVIVIIAVVVTIILTLSVVGLIVCIRRHRRQRSLDDALKPWTSGNSNQFSKVSSMDDGPRSPGIGMGDTGSGHDGIGMSSIAGAGAGTGVGIGAGRMSSTLGFESQPMLPQPSRGGSYYPDDGDYGHYGIHHQQQQELLQHNYHPPPQQQQQQRQGYDGYNNEEENYYNPYYASGIGGFGAGAATFMNQSSPSFYNMNNNSGNGTQHYNLQQHQAHLSGYFPPPPPLSGPPVSSRMSGTSAEVSATPPGVPGLSGASEASGASGTSEVTSSETAVPTTSILTSLPTNSSITSSPKRAPQSMVMQGMERKEAKEEAQDDSIKVPISPTGKEKVEITLM